MSNMEENKSGDNERQSTKDINIDDLNNGDASTEVCEAVKFIFKL